MLHWDFFFLLTYYQQRVCKLALGEWKLLFKNIWILRNWTSKRNIKTGKKKKFIHICRLCARIKHFALINASFQRLANEKDFFSSFYTFSPSFSFCFFSLYVLFRFFRGIHWQVPRYPQYNWFMPRMYKGLWSDNLRLQQSLESKVCCWESVMFITSDRAKVVRKEKKRNSWVCDLSYVYR